MPNTNFFSSKLFFSTIANIYYPESKYSIKSFEVEGEVYLLLVIDGNKIISDFTLLDYLTAEKKYNKRHLQKIDYLARVEKGIVKIDESCNNLQDTYLIHNAPFIDLRLFSSYGDYLKMIEKRNHDFVTNSNRRERKLEREQGKPQYVYNCQDIKLLDMCIAWKEKQLEKTGGTEAFADPRLRQFLLTLLQKKVLRISTLAVKSTPIAISVGVEYQKSYYGWISAYDFDYSAYAPGRLLLLFIIAENLKRKNQYLDFLLGSEKYKWIYATNFRIVGPVGSPSVAIQITNLKLYLQSFCRTNIPTIYYFLKRQFLTLKSYASRIQK